MPCTDKQRENIMGAGKIARQNIEAARASRNAIETTINSQTKEINKLKGDRKNDKQRIAIQKKRQKNISERNYRRNVVKDYEKDLAAQKKMNNDDVCKFKF